ncbi:unnamed protein product, partial [marine sediment metagenome]
MNASLIDKKINTPQAACQPPIIDKRQPLKTPWVSLPPLIQEALKLGLTLTDETQIKTPEDLKHKKVKLPMGHRFYPDCLREQSARLIDWTMSKYPNDSWFMTC